MVYVYMGFTAMGVGDDGGVMYVGCCATTLEFEEIAMGIGTETGAAAPFGRDGYFAGESMEEIGRGPSWKIGKRGGGEGVVFGEDDEVAGTTFATTPRGSFFG